MCLFFGSIPINICMAGEVYVKHLYVHALGLILNKGEEIHLGSALLSSRATLNF